MPCQSTADRTYRDWDLVEDDAHSASWFQSSDRFIVKQRLGHGGMGAVYEAFDRARGMDVALKSLVRLEASPLLRFKQEFRALSDVSHRNLVALYELLSHEGEWFFTMERVRGRNLVAYLTGETERADAATPICAEQATAATATLPLTGRARRHRVPTNLDYEQVREVIRQLARGVQALHEHGYLHRDIKPSNIMVEDDGRVVLLDFGIISELRPNGRTTLADEVVGTPSYMAPEQIDKAASSASDWYAVGGVLYRVLTGRPPFVGNAHDVLAIKQSAAPRAAAEFVPDLPEDLSSLCNDLLLPRPGDRPQASEIMWRLAPHGRPARRPSAPPTLRTAAHDEIVIGRCHELAQLRAALARVRGGQGGLALVHGESGMGKSALVRTFLDEAQLDGTLVLRGRCYERESLPFKAVDSLVDSLTRHLMELPTNEAESLVPADAQLLAKLFPVLKRIRSIAVPRVKAFGSPDPRESRARAFEALRKLLSRLAARQPLVLFVDDLQWGDNDSVSLLDSVIGRDMPPLLFVAAYRSTDAERSPLLRELLPKLEAREEKLTIGLEPLAAEGAAKLARVLLTRAGASTTAAASIAGESGGHPYFISELARFHARGGAADAPSLEAMIQRRLAACSPPGQAVLAVLAVAGHPVREDVLREASGLERGELSTQLMSLRGAQLLRSSGASTNRLLECYHDRIREVLLRTLSRERLADIHRAIAESLQARDGSDPEDLAEHLAACGECTEAAGYLEIAADRAVHALSFVHAADLYRRALELGRYDAAGERSLQERTGRALMLSGRLAEAAVYFDRAAELSDGVAATRLRLAAGQALLWNGLLEDGQDRLGGVLRELGMKLPATPRRAVAALLYRRLQLAVRGFGFKPRDPGLISERERLQVDASWVMSLGLSQIDPARAGLFSAVGALRALAIGDRFRAVRALSVEAGCRASVGIAGRQRGLELVERATSVADLDDPREQALLALSRGFVGFETGFFAEGLEHCLAAEELFRTQCTGAALEICTSQFFALLSLLFMGRFGEMDELSQPWLTAMHERGDIYQATNIRTTVSPAVYLRRDDPEAALAEAQAALNDWGQKGFHNPTLNAATMMCVANLYRGDATAARAVVDDYDPMFRRSLLRHVQVIRGFWYLVRSACRLASAARCDGRERRALIAKARRDGARLRREGATWCAGIGELTTAGVAWLSDDPDQARLRLRSAVALLDEAGAGLFAETARYHLGRLVGGDEGADLVDTALTTLRELGFVAPERAALTLAPAFNG